jgi:hypothetical protein
VIRNLSPSSRHSVPADLCSTPSPARAGVALEEEPSRHDDGSSQYSYATRIDVCKISDIEFSKLRIARAYIRLLCIPEGAAKMVSLARIGNYEVRMLECSQSSFDAAPLFSMELFDHDAQSPVDSCICCGIDEGAAAFQDFISR